MRTTSLLLLVAFAALAESRRGVRLRRAKRELLVRSKRRWVLTTIELDEEDTGPFPREISKMYNDKKDASGQLYHISGVGVDEEPIGVFSMDENTGVVFAHKAVDRERNELFKIQFDIVNKLTGKTIDKELSINIEVKDINDNPPYFEPGLEADVPEDTAEGTALTQLRMTDKDQSNTPNSKIAVSKLSQSPAEPEIDVKQIDNGVAQLSLNKGCFDYNKVKKYEIVLQLRDHGTPTLSSTGVVTINIVDKNSHLPTFREKKLHGEVLESATEEDVLRIAVDDKDGPETPGWRAKYFFINGNEGGDYTIETDPETNEGILSVVRGLDFEKNAVNHLLVGVENEEALFVCESGSPGGARTPPSPDTVNVTIKVIDVNDPPHYEKTLFHVYRAEEEEPGEVLFTPKVSDDDSDVSKARHVLLEDPAGWVKIDEKTGTITSTEKMDRESSFVGDDNIYKIVIGAVDDGEPPARGTCTVLVHLGDINDHEPRLAGNGLILCGNKGDKVMVAASDADAKPFSGPFTFTLGSDEKALAERWKLDPSFGEEAGLISRTTLPFDNYSVPLLIQDQQSSAGRHTVEVMVCDCGEGDVCLPKPAPSSSLGPAGIGLLFLGLLLFLLLLLVFVCQCRGKDFQRMPMVQDEGNQTLIKYNQEGGGSSSMSEPTLLLTPTNSEAVTDGLKMATMQSQMSQMAPVMTQDTDTYNSVPLGMINSNMTSRGSRRHRDTIRSHRGQSMYSTWNSNRMNTYQGGSSRYNRSVSLWSNQQHISDHIDRRMYEIDGHHESRPVYQPHEYAYEGQGSECHSLDQLSLSNLGDDLMFLNDLGPKFKTLAGVCNQTMQEKNMQL